MDPRPKILGIGADVHSDLYGIWLPFFNRFLIVYHEIGTIQKLRSILSSKLRTYVIHIRSAENYEHNIIDNDVCLDWGVSPDFSKLLFGAYLPDFKDFSLAGQKKCVDQDLVDLQNFALECLCWCLDLKKLCSMSDSDLYSMTTVHSTLTLEYKPILSYHEDAMSSRCLSTIDAKMREMSDKLLSFRLHCERSMYWAQDVNDIRRSIKSIADSDHVTDSFLKAIHA